MRRWVTQRGVALLAAMLTVTLVAALAAGALWQQWRGVEVEAAERARVQSGWVLTGALDWSRLILREDARNGGADHLGEPWATPLAEARLSSFLAQNKDDTLGGPDAFLSGRIIDAQSRMNLTNLVEGNQLSASNLLAFAKLCALVGVPDQQLQTVAENLRLALDTRGETPGADTAMLVPQRVEQLRWLGLDAQSLQRLQPYVTVLPVATPINLNTASAEVIYASVPKLNMADARRLVQARERSPFNTLTQAEGAVSSLAGQLNTAQHGVASRFFLIYGQLRLEQSVLQERSLVQRNGLEVTTLWRERMTPDGLSTMPVGNHAP